MGGPRLPTRFYQAPLHQNKYQKQRSATGTIKRSDPLIPYAMSSDGTEDSPGFQPGKELLVSPPLRHARQQRNMSSVELKPLPTVSFCSRDLDFLARFLLPGRDNLVEGLGTKYQVTDLPL